MPLTAAEVKSHPEFPHVVWKLKPEKEGKLPVAKGRGGPFKIHYQVHGHGPRLIALVMGLGSLSTSWQRQTKDFGHAQADRYSVLVMDNRGIGQSDKPFMRYSTSEMARDTIEIMNHIGWTKPRSVNVVGVSMGGMIAQEMAMLIPDRMSTLTLLSTAAQVINTVGFMEHMRQRVSMFVPKSLDTAVANTKRMLYTTPYLDSPDEVEPIVKSFPTAGDRIAAIEITKRTTPGFYTRNGFISQALAAGWHKKSKKQLAQIGKTVGRDRIMVIHGELDKMITVPHGRTLAAGLSGDGQEVKTVFFKDEGHTIPIEKRKEFNQLVEDLIEKFHTDAV